MNRPKDTLTQTFSKGYCPAEMAFSVLIARLTFLCWAPHAVAYALQDLGDNVSRDLERPLYHAVDIWP